MTNLKRMLILGLTLVATIVAISLGSVFYVSKNSKTSIEYSGGQEYVVKIKTHGTNSSSISTEVADAIYDRIDSLGVGGASVETGTSGGFDTVRVRYPGLTSAADRKALENLITQKPHLTFTDVYGNSLFNNSGKFPTQLSGLAAPATTPIAGLDNYAQSTVPLKSDGAKAIFTGTEHQVEITLRSGGELEWKAATEYISKLTAPDNKVVAWLDVTAFESELKTLYNNGSLGSTPLTGNPYADASVNSVPGGTLRHSTIDSSRYLISAASVKAGISTQKFVLSGNFSQKEAEALAQKLNYGAANYDLELLSSRSVPAIYGASAFRKAIIAGIVVFAIIAIFLMVNYGLLGALSTISIALYMFLTLLMFTVMKGEYSPATIAAIIIGLGMSVDANIITFERLKNELYLGSSVKRANKQANRQSLSAIFDANITTLIIAFVLFYFGTRNIMGLSITLMLSIFFTLIVMLGFTRITAALLLNTGYFDNNKAWIGVKKTFDEKAQTVLNKPDYIKTSKWFAWSSLGVIVVGILVFAITAGIGHSMVHGMNFSKEFTGGTDILIKTGSVTGVIAAGDVTSITSTLTTAGVPLSDIHHVTNAAGDVTSMTVDSTANINATTISADISSVNRHLMVDLNTISNETAKEIVKDAMIAVAISIGLIIVYTLIRFKWTYSLAAVIALVHDALIIIAIFAVIRVEVSPIFVVGVLSIVGYSINDTIVTFDRIRENMKANVGKLDATGIKRIGNQAVKDTIKRSILTSLTTITAVVVLMSFGNATKLAFNLAMLIGLMAGTYSSIFIATNIWSRLEIRRQRGMAKRDKNDFWKTEGIEEQSFNGINDFKA